MAVICLFYSIIMGLMVPLGPGIKEVAPNHITTGSEVTLKITGFHTHFTQAKENLRFWLIYFDRATGKQTEVCAKDIKVLNDGVAEARFDLTGGLNFPAKDSFIQADVMGNNAVDGNFVIVQEVSLKKGSAGAENVAVKCDFEVANKKAAFFNFPYKNSLYETERNLFFHVPMWFAMMVLFFISLFYSVKYLRSKSPLDDIRASRYINVGLVFALCGMLTGMIWARFTWGKFWVFEDPKLNGAAIVSLLYVGYVVLRGSIQEQNARARVSAVFNIFAAASIIPLLFIYPKMSESLHPGNGGNPAFSMYDQDNNMRLIFYPAVIGWILLSLWITQLAIRVSRLSHENH